MSGALKVFLVAGEPSGDALGCKLMAGLKKISKREVEFFGVGGPLMEAEGLKSLFPMEELTVMGLAEVLPKIPALLKRIRETANEALIINPDVFVTIDAPDFSFRVAKKLKGAPFSKVHYVAPSVWAWRPGRAKKIAGLYDHLLTILPFEPPYFEKEDLASSFVGHSVIEVGAGQGNAEKFCSAHGLEPDGLKLMLLPGSRKGEVTRHLPIFKETLDLVHRKIPDFQVIVPVIGKTRDLVMQEMKGWQYDVLFVEGNEKYDAMAASTASLAASGTVGLELGLAGLPSVIAYKMHPLTAFIARKLIKLPYVNLVNILEEKEIVPEHILEFCQPDTLAKSVIELLESEEKRNLQKAGYQSAVKKLGLGDRTPGERAAEVVLKLAES
ncbi:MAG: lipid-A-disaccharide synthase [Sneathiellales bacterium]|nr:lipid-A-disaccharide synthase [Sneathiellales bacterium]